MSSFTSQSGAERDAARGTVQQIFDWILRGDNAGDIKQTLTDAGWQETDLIPFARLHRRIEINALNTVFGILTRKVYRMVFSYYRASRNYHSVHGVDVRFLLDCGITAIQGWRHPNHPKMVLFATQHHQSGGAAPDWTYIGVWVFAPGHHTGSEKDLLIPTDQFDSIFNGEGQSCRTLSGNYNGANHSWQRSESSAFGSVFRAGAYGDNSGCRLRIAKFLAQLLPGWALPEHPMLYSAERFFTNYS